MLAKTFVTPSEQGANMTRNEIEHMWKVASNNPNHDTNWHDPAVEAFAKLVAKHTLLNTDPSSFMSHQEGFAAGKQTEREAIAQSLDKQADLAADEIDRQWAQEMAAAVRARGQT